MSGDTPVNNRLADLKNQIAFATEADDTALAAQGIASVDATMRLAQKQFNRSLALALDGRLGAYDLKEEFPHDGRVSSSPKPVRLPATFCPLLLTAILQQHGLENVRSL